MKKAIPLFFSSIAIHIILLILMQWIPLLEILMIPFPNSVLSLLATVLANIYFKEKIVTVLIVSVIEFVTFFTIAAVIVAFSFAFGSMP